MYVYLKSTQNNLAWNEIIVLTREKHEILSSLPAKTSHYTQCMYYRGDRFLQVLIHLKGKQELRGQLQNLHRKQRKSNYRERERGCKFGRKNQMEGERKDTRTLHTHDFSNRTLEPAREDILWIAQDLVLQLGNNTFSYNHVQCKCSLFNRPLAVHILHVHVPTCTVASYAGFPHFVVEMWKVCVRGYVHVHEYNKHNSQSNYTIV